jgi:hypothetical protein
MTIPIELNVRERRKSPRRAVSQMVRLELNDGSLNGHPGLLVTDISDGGARLFARNVDIPEKFTLVFADSGIRRECRMVWRIGPEVGLEFTDEPARSKKRRRR